MIKHTPTYGEYYHFGDVMIPAGEVMYVRKSSDGTCEIVTVRSKPNDTLKPFLSIRSTKLYDDFIKENF